MKTSTIPIHTLRTNIIPSHQPDEDAPTLARTREPVPAPNPSPNPSKAMPLPHQQATLPSHMHPLHPLNHHSKSCHSATTAPNGNWNGPDEN
jgi:hypothetical protein